MCFIYAVIYIIGMTFPGEMAYAAETEQISEDAAQQEVEPTGVLVVENDGSFGIVDVYYDDKRQVVSCDYSELEIPVEAMCVLEVCPFSGYEVEMVTVNGKIIESQDGKYCVLLEDGFIMVAVKYKKVDRSDSKGDSSNQLGRKDEEHVSNQVYENDGSDKGQSSVSAISYNVKVTYLEIDSVEGDSLNSEKEPGQSGERPGSGQAVESNSSKISQAVNDSAEEMDAADEGMDNMKEESTTSEAREENSEKVMDQKKEKQEASDREGEIENSKKAETSQEETSLKSQKSVQIFKEKSSSKSQNIDKPILSEWKRKYILIFVTIFLAGIIILIYKRINSL